MISNYLPMPELSTLARTIELAVAPFFLLAGIGQFLNLLAGRLARVVDRARRLEQEFTAADHPRHRRQVRELRLLDGRIRVVNSAIFLCTLSAVLICLVVAGLFVANLTDVRLGRIVAIAFVAAMLLLIVGLVLFLFEVRLAMRSVRVPGELLERERGQ